MVEQRPAPIRTSVPAESMRPAATASALTPKEVFLIFRRHVLLIMVFTVLGLMTGGAAWKLLLRYLPEYTAQTYIEILPPVDTDPMTIATAMVQKDILYGHRLSMANLIKQQSTLRELIDKDKIKETEWFKSFGMPIDRAIRKAYRDLLKHFSAVAHRDADFVVLSMSCGSKKEAALIVNEMVDLFLRGQGTTKTTEILARLTELETRRDAVQRELDGAEKALSDVRTTSGIIDLERIPGRWNQNVITLKLQALELEGNDLVLAVRQTQADMKNLERLATEPVAEQVKHQIENDPVMLSLAQQLALTEATLAGQLTRYGENHKIVRRTRKLIAEIEEERKQRQDNIAEQTRIANYKNAQDLLTVLQERLTELQTLRDEADKKKQDLDNARVQYEQRVAIRDERRATLDEIKKQIVKLRIMSKDPEAPKVRFVGYAPEPLEVSAPRWEFYFPGGTVLGLLAGMGLAFLIEMLNDLVRTPRDVARFLRIPLLSMIPDATEDDLARDVDLCHVVRQAPYSILSEAYRRLRTNLRLSKTSESLKSLLVTSGSAGEGKTSVAVNLAAAFVTEDKRVLLIDANFRRPNLHTLFPKQTAEDQSPQEPATGLSTLLAGQCGLDDVIRPSGVEGLDIVDSGPVPANPAELLDAAPMKDIIEQRGKNYDYVIIDGPPVLLVSDTKVLAKLVDATLLVFNAAATRRGAAQRTIRELRNVTANIVGCTLFAVKAMKGGYFREQFKSYRKYQELQLAHSV